MPAAFKKPGANSKELKLDSVVRLLEGCLDGFTSWQSKWMKAWKGYFFYFDIGNQNIGLFGEHLLKYEYIKRRFGGVCRLSWFNFCNQLSVSSCNTYILYIKHWLSWAKNCYCEMIGSDSDDVDKLLYHFICKSSVNPLRNCQMGMYVTGQVKMPSHWSKNPIL